ncbi:cytochrome P450 [Hypoxylon sp. NC1633]|nr:cytochrome P450 [Hypoxylon sp. NC1633]
MAWTNYGMFLVLSSFGLLFLQWLRAKEYHHRKLHEVWAKLSVVGVSPGSRISFFGAVAKSILSTRQLVNEGYHRFSKTLDRPFALPTTWVRSGSVVVLPPSRVPLLTQPDRTSEAEWTNLPGLVETIQLPYIITDPNIYQNVLHFEVVRRKMQYRDMERLAPVTADEVDKAFRDIWGAATTWKTMNGWEACGRVISRVSQRILIGLPLSRDESLLETSRQYANSLLVGGAIINCFPPALRWIVAPLVTLRARYFQARFVNILVPVVEERIRYWEAGRDDSPDDFLQWMIPICAKEGVDQLDATRIALRLVSLLTPLIFAVCYVFSHCVLDVHGSAAGVDVLESLREECVRVSAEYPGLATSESVNALFRIDSTLRESMRVSDVAVTNLFRDVTSGEIDVGNGMRIGPGVRMVFPTQNIHLDPDNYKDPRKYDAFRFSRPYENVKGDKRERELITTTTPTFLPFGYGRHACPGRWFAAQLMKQALAYMVLNYELELVGEPVKRKALLNTMVPPVNVQVRVRRRT